VGHDLYLTKSSSLEDAVKAMAQLREDIANNVDIPADAKVEALKELDLTSAAVEQKEPPQAITNRLERVKSALLTVGGTVASITTLAGNIAGLVAWFTKAFGG
jgi:hypothetical protein